MKKKLIASAVSLAMALVMLTSASFAWFTVSTAPEVSEVKMTMEATKNLEIGLGTIDSGALKAPSEVAIGDATTGESTWGSKVTSLYGAEINFPAFLDADGELVTIAYDASGRVQAATTTSSVTMPTTWTNAVAGTNTIYGTATSDVIIGAAVITGAKVAAIYPVWLRSNTALSAVKVTVNANDATLKQDGDDYTLATAGKSVDDVLKVTVMKEANNSWTAVPDTGMSLEANTPTLVYVVVYMDGTYLTAADVAADLTVEGVKVTFADAAVDTFAAQHAAG